MTLFERIKVLAKKRGFTLPELADEANIGEKSIYAWKPSKRFPNGVTPKRSTLEKVAKVLGVTVDYLITGSEKDTPEKELAERPKLQKIARKATKLDDKQLDKLDDVMNAIFDDVFGDDGKNE